MPVAFHLAGYFSRTSKIVGHRFELTCISDIAHIDPRYTSRLVLRFQFIVEACTLLTNIHCARACLSGPVDPQSTPLPLIGPLRLKLDCFAIVFPHFGDISPKSTQPLKLITRAIPSEVDVSLTFTLSLASLV